jgi:hypothetical protein
VLSSRRVGEKAAFVADLCLMCNRGPGGECAIPVRPGCSFWLCGSPASLLLLLSHWCGVSNSMTSIDDSRNSGTGQGSIWPPGECEGKRMARQDSDPERDLFHGT